MRHLILAILSIFLFSTTADAWVLCAKKDRRTGSYREGTAVKLRNICRNSEVEVDPAEIGIEGSAGPEGPKGDAGEKGETGDRGPAGDTGQDGVSAPTWIILDALDNEIGVARIGESVYETDTRGQLTIDGRRYEVDIGNFSSVNEVIVGGRGDWAGGSIYFKTPNCSGPPYLAWYEPDPLGGPLGDRIGPIQYTPGAPIGTSAQVFTPDFSSTPETVMWSRMDHGDYSGGYHIDPSGIVGGPFQCAEVTTDIESIYPPVKLWRIKATEIQFPIRIEER